MDDKVREWSAEILLLAKIGESQPHAAVAEEAGKSWGGSSLSQSYLIAS